MTTLADWIEYGLPGEHYRNKAKFRRWLNEARERRPVIDRVNYPDEYRSIAKFRRVGGNRQGQ